MVGYKWIEYKRCMVRRVYERVGGQGSVDWVSYSK